MLGSLFSKSSGKKVFLPAGSTKNSAQLLARVIEELRYTISGGVPRNQVKRGGGTILRGRDQ